MNGRRYLLLLPLAALALLSQWLLRSPGQAAPEAPVREVGYYLLEGRLRGVSDDGEALFEISAARVRQQPALARVALEDVRVTWADSDALPWRLRARDGFIGADWRLLELRGDVRIEGLDPGGGTVTLDTERLTVMLDEKQASTRSRVTVAGDRGIVLAEGMTADLQAQLFVLESDVRGRFDAAADEPPEAVRP